MITFRSAVGLRLRGRHEERDVGHAMVSTQARRYAARGSRKVHGIVRTGAFPLILALDAAQKSLGVRGPVGEIGVFYGKLLILLALLARDDEAAVAVDIFDHPGLKEVFLSNLRRYVDPAKCHILQADSRTLGPNDLSSAASGKLRLISVDGDHSAEAVEHDLELARDSLASGGIVLLDDYFQESFPGVSEATNRFFLTRKNGDLVPFAIGGNKLFLCSKRFAPDYRRALLAEQFPASSREEELFGHPVLCYNFAPHNFFGFNVSQRWVNSAWWRAIRENPIGHFIRFRLRRL